MLKEEGDSSHVNQAYDKFVAKSDKAHKRHGLSMLRGMQFSGVNGSKIADQWSLLQVGLFVIRGTAPETWMASFEAVNMDPRTRVSFSDWCKRISQALQTGGQFKVEETPDEYSLLSPIWHGMNPEEKKKTVSIIDECDGNFTVECCNRLNREVSIRYKDLQNIRVCYDKAKENPTHLDMGAPMQAAIEAAHLNPELEAAHAEQKPLTDGLASYQLKPKGTKMSQIEKFNHMVGFRKRDPSLKGDSSEPSSYLDVTVSDGQRELLRLSSRDFTMRNIMKDAGGTKADQKLAKRKLDMHGNIKSHSGLQNDEKRLKSLRNELQLADSIAEIARVDKASKAKKKNESHQELLELAPKARDNLQAKNGNVSKITKKEISSILLMYYSIDKSASCKKDELVSTLEKAIASDGSPANRSAVASAALLNDSGEDSDDDDHGETEIVMGVEPHFYEGS